MESSNTKIILPVQLRQVIDKVDRSCSLRFVTRELTNNEFAGLRDMRNLEGWILFSPNDIQSKEIDEIPRERAEIGTKTPSQRLRAVLYLLWKQNKDDSLPVNEEEFYKSEMEKIITHYKNKLDGTD